MKAILLLLIALSVVSCRFQEEYLRDKSYDLLKGFLDGILEKGNADELKKCMTELDLVVSQMVRAVALIFTYHKEKVELGIHLMVDATRKFIDILKPCSKGYPQIEKLLEAYQEPDIFDMLRKLLTKPRGYFEAVTSFLEALKKNNYYVVGLSLGRVNYAFFLDKTPRQEFNLLDDASDADDLLKGFLKGLKETGDFYVIRKCLVKLDDIVNRMIEAVEMIYTFDESAVIMGFIMLVKATSDFIDMLGKCSEGYEQIIKLINSMNTTDRFKLLRKVLEFPRLVFDPLIMFLEALGEKKYFDVGLGLGQINYELFINIK